METSKRERLEVLETSICTVESEMLTEIRERSSVVWRHREVKLLRFLDHLNGVHAQIQFTIGEEAGKLTFLTVLVHRRSNGG